MEQSQKNINIPFIVAGLLFSSCLLAALVLHAAIGLLTGLIAFALTRAIVRWLQKYDSRCLLKRHEFFAAFTRIARFGPVGMALAPVFYAFIKAELRRIQWLAC